MLVYAHRHALRCTVPGVDAIVLFLNKSWKTKHEMKQSASQLKKLQTEEVVGGEQAAEEGRGVCLTDFDNQSHPSAHSVSQSQQCIAYHVRAKMLVLQQKYATKNFLEFINQTIAFSIFPRRKLITFRNNRQLIDRIDSV